MVRPNNFNVHPMHFQGGAPNNDLIRAKMAAAEQERKFNPRAQGTGEYLQELPHRVKQTGMGEYTQELPYRSLLTKGPGTAAGGVGPVTAPTIQSPEVEARWTSDDILRQILYELQRMPENLATEARTRFPIPPREAISFINPSGNVTVAAGAAAAIVSQTVQERFSGFLTHVGVNVVGGAFADITWQIRVNGSVHPEFANRIFSQNHVPDPLPFIFELTQARTLELVAINGGAIDLDVDGVLVGWTEFLANFKPYGSSPQSGIA